MAALDARTLGQRIRDARKRADLSQEDLGSAVGLDRTAVAKIESGARRLTALELADVAEAIGVRMATFFEEPVPAVVSHRSHQGLDTAESRIDALLADLAAEVEFVATLGAWTADPVPDGAFAAPTSSDEAESMASGARTLLGLGPDEPIPSLATTVAGVGLLAFSRDLGKDTADAGTVLLPRGAVSLVNSHMKVGRRRLALAHELGHYLVQDDYTVDWRVAEGTGAPLESRLDRFARALLLPASAVSPLWRERSDRNGERAAAITLASEFRVDMATLAARLRELHLTDGAVVAAVREYRPTRADFVELDLHAPLEELQGTTVPQAFARAVLTLVRQSKISRERALDLLQGTFAEDDLPQPRRREPGEIWSFVS